MSDKNIYPLLRNLLIAFVLYTVGRYIVVEMGSNGTWLILGGVVVFYAVWWANYQRNKRNKR